MRNKYKKNFLVRNKKILMGLSVVPFVLLFLLFSTVYEKKSVVVPYVEKKPIWAVRSIDTVKYSRDLAREKLTNLEYDKEIDIQVDLIAQTGASHVAIGTPYDAEFVPYLRRWVLAARRHHLNVWFRGNMSGWEGWFGYKDLTKEEHINGIEEFILTNPDLFENGDIFSSCTECENGALGDPRQTGKVDDYRKFLIDEYSTVKVAFSKIDRRVQANYYSMNGDIAKLIMDENTTKALDGLIVIDHYVKDAKSLVTFAKELELKSNGNIVFGEWGAPIPDIHGEMSDKEQAEWIKTALEEMGKDNHIVGINYWTGRGSSTQLWESDKSARSSVSVITEYYTKRVTKN